MVLRKRDEMDRKISSVEQLDREINDARELYELAEMENDTQDRKSVV